MTAPRPVNHQNNLSAFLFHIGNDLADQYPHDPLLQSLVSSRRVPNRRQILRQNSKELLYSVPAQIGSHHRTPAVSFQVLLFSAAQHSIEPLILRPPTASGSTDSYRRARQTCFVTSLLEFQLDGLAQILSLLLHLLRGFQCGLQRIFADCL